MSDIIFLMSIERCGSNLITRIMGSHEQVCGIANSNLITTIALNLYKYYDLKGPNWNRLIQDIFHILSKKHTYWSKNYTIQELHDLAGEADLRTLLQKIHTGETTFNQKKLTLIRENSIHRFSHFLDKLFPEASYIGMVRDPRDMAASWIKNPVLRGGVVRSTQRWKYDVQGYLQMRGWMPHKNIPIIRYEDLLTDPQHHLSLLCEIANIEYSPSMLDFYKDNLTIVNATTLTSVQRVKEPLDSKNTQKYLSVLNNDEITYAENICSPEMEAFGYDRTKPALNGHQMHELERALIDKEPYAKENYKLIPEKEREKLQNSNKVIAQINNSSFHLL